MPQVYFDLGTIYAEQGDKAKAKEYYEYAYADSVEINGKDDEITQLNDQVKVLQRLAKMFKDKEALTQLIDAGTDAEGCRIIQDYLGDLVEIV